MKIWRERQRTLASDEIVSYGYPECVSSEYNMQDAPSLVGFPLDYK